MSTVPGNSGPGWWRPPRRSADPQEQAAAVASEQAEPMVPEPIPDVPVDTKMLLEYGEWRGWRGDPADCRVHLRLVEIHRSIVCVKDGYTWVWVGGHDSLTCRLSSVEPHKPCTELLVRVDVLARHVQ